MKLKSMTSIIAQSVTVLAACAALNAAAGTAPVKNPVPVEPEPSALFDSIGATLDVGYDSRYYYRGLWFADNIVWTALNLSIPLIGGSGEDGAGSLTWGIGATYISTVETPFNNLTAAGVANARSTNAFDYSELDLVTSLTYDAGFAKFGVQYLHYFYPDSYGGSYNGLSNVGPGNNEFGIKGAGEIGLTVVVPIGAANIYGGYYYDFKVGGSYMSLGADYTIAITDWLSIVPSITSGYGNDYYTGNNSRFTNAAATAYDGSTLGTTSGFTHILYSIAAPIKLTKIATLTPYIAYNQSMDMRAQLNATPYEVFGGVKLSVAF